MLSKIKAWMTTPAFNSVRAMLYVAVPAVLVELVKEGRLTQDHANLWGAVAVAAFGPALASFFAPNGWKTWLFGLFAPIQAALVGLGGANNVWLMLTAAVLGSVITSGLAASNVHTTESASGT